MSPRMVAPVVAVTGPPAMMRGPSCVWIPASIPGLRDQNKSFINSYLYDKVIDICIFNIK